MTKRVEKRARKPVSENQGMFCTCECVSASVCLVQCLYFFFVFLFYFIYLNVVGFFFCIFILSRTCRLSVLLFRTCSKHVWFYGTPPCMIHTNTGFLGNLFEINIIFKQTNKQESVTVESRRDDSVHIWCVRRWFLAENEARFPLLERWQKTL